MTDKQLLLISILFNLGILGMFFLSFRKDKTKLRNSVLFNLFLLFVSLNVIISANVFNNPILNILFMLVIIIYFIIGAFGFVVLIIGLLINSRYVLKRESFSIANLLTLFLAVSLLLYFFITGFTESIESSLIKNILIYISIMVIYFGFSFYNFVLLSIFNSFYKPKHNLDYIIVLGSGLIDGYRVSKLLGSRIDTAINAYKHQKENNNHTTILLSGGQGPDENLPEAEAMAKYALEKGVPQSDLLIENKSTTTLENFKFSKEIMDRESVSYEAVFSTSSYHVLRANIYARQVGLDISGIGAKTAFYFLPNAIIREYIAILVMKKKTYLFRIILISLVYLLFVLLSIYTNKLI